MSDVDGVMDASASMRVVRGAPNDDELAALVAGMAAMASVAHDEEEPGSPTSAWMDRARTMRGIKVGVLGRGPGAWRHSLR
ncbi:acyl-CoA carboxylase subunit epsilon [Demequina sp. TTPB684]|uniref:acyl-CoA carboxylase subunit epsilon n=1 Tax=unclassified Demequina TaxID=2620311 RepID=UPI001CF1C492|nr:MULTISPECIES: acyl-CoA carboxylase subunit epsilon [unclassified Demequina]MCB2413533.1 acyl-CoA carboxylase subunit epsilon [Demequina sp. TTPB684]UPU87245.1 acyl-CoA carboxylase subunit epsilon [Demequina sp. TMPB413]